MAAKPAAGTPYARAYEAGREAQRRLLLDAAGRLLETEGPQALTMRRIAGELGCSTSVLYTMFGGKAGVAEGLWCEGFERLHAALSAAAAAAGSADPLARLAAMGRAYRESARADRSYYAVMFQRSIPGFAPSPEARAVSLRPLQLLVDAVTACMEAGVFRSADPGYVARVLWAASHGSVSLELAGYEGAEDRAGARYDDLLAAAASWFMVDGGRRSDVPVRE